MGELKGASRSIKPAYQRSVDILAVVWRTETNQGEKNDMQAVWYLDWSCCDGSSRVVRLVAVAWNVEALSRMDGQTMVTVRVALRGWQGGSKAPYDWAKVLLCLRQADPTSTAPEAQSQLTTADKQQLAPQTEHGAGEHGPTYLHKLSNRCRINKVSYQSAYRQTHLALGPGSELKSFFFVLVSASYQGITTPPPPPPPPSLLTTPGRSTERNPVTQNPPTMSNQNESAAWPIADAALTQVRPAPKETDPPRTS